MSHDPDVPTVVQGIVAKVTELSQNLLASPWVLVPFLDGGNGCLGELPPVLLGCWALWNPQTQDWAS